MKIVTEGDKTSGLHIIIKGRVVVSKNNVVERFLNPGEFFGESSLFHESIE